MRSIPNGWKQCPGRAIASSARKRRKRGSWKKFRINASAKSKEEMLGISSFPFFRILSVEIERYFNRHLNRHRPSVFLRWIELPVLYALDSLFVQSHSKRTDHFGAMHAAINSNHDVENDNTLILRLARFLREFRFRSKDGTRCANAIHARTKISRSY